MKMKDIRINGRNLARLSYGRRLSLNEGWILKKPEKVSKRLFFG
jgi:hypothetical protein